MTRPFVRQPNPPPGGPWAEALCRALKDVNYAEPRGQLTYPQVLWVPPLEEMVPPQFWLVMSPPGPLLFVTLPPPPCVAVQLFHAHPLALQGYCCWSHQQPRSVSQCRDALASAAVSCQPLMPIVERLM